MTTALLISLNLGIKAVSIISAGCLIGLGFWTSKLLNNKIEMMLAIHDEVKHLRAEQTAQVLA